MKTKLTSSSLFLVLAVALAVFWSTPASAGYINLPGMVACNTGCYNFYYLAKKNCGQTPDWTGFNMCNGLCRAIDAAGGCFGWDACMNICKAGGNGGWATYYGVTVPCVTICNALFP